MPQSPKIITTTLIAAIALIITAILVLGAVPPVSRDALTHHLFVPKLYLQHQGMVEIPWLKFSYYPMNLDMLYLLPLALGNDILPKYIHCGFGLLTALLIYMYLRRWLSRTYAYAGILLFLAIPVIVKLCITIYVDLGLVFFSTAALFFLLKWVEFDLRLKYIVYSGLFCGLALGTKYNGLLVFCIMFLMIPLVGMRWLGNNRASHGVMVDNPSHHGHGLKKVLLHWCLFAAVVLLVFSPWMIRNAVWTGNPLHPLYQSSFKKLHQIVKKDRIATPTNLEKKKNPAPKPNHFMVRRQIFKEDGLDILLIPIRIFFQGQDDNPKYFDGRLTPLLLVLPLFALVGFRSDDRFLRLGKLIWLAFAVLYLLIAFLSVDMRVRYVAPIIPPLTILSVLGLHNIVELIDERFNGFNCKVFKFLLIILIVGVWLDQLGYLAKQYKVYRPDLYIRGQVSRQDYIQRFRPEYAALSFANQNLPEDSCILGIYLGGRGYYSDYAIRFDNQLIERIARKSVLPQDIGAQLEKHGFTHIVISMDLFNQWSAPNFTADQVALVQSFFRDEAQLLFHKDSHALYQIGK